MSSEERMKLIGCACNGKTCPYCGTWKKALEEAARECDEMKKAMLVNAENISSRNLALDFERAACFRDAAARIRALKGEK